MRQFMQRGPSIAALSVDARIIYSAFLLMSLAGVLLSLVYFDEITGSRPLAGVREYYAGEVASPPPALRGPADSGGAPELSDGPALDLPADDELLDGPLVVPMSRRKLLEVTHFHLFSIPVFLLIIAHIFVMCPMAVAIRRAVILLGVLSTAAHIAAPWLVARGGGGWAWSMAVTGICMGGAMLIMTAWPLWAMWRPDRQDG